MDTNAKGASHELALTQAKAPVTSTRPRTRRQPHIHTETGFTTPLTQECAPITHKISPLRPYGMRPRRAAPRALPQRSVSANGAGQPKQTLLKGAQTMRQGCKTSEPLALRLYGYIVRHPISVRITHFSSAEPIIYHEHSETQLRTLKRGFNDFDDF
ncbi:hypothetical protein BV20DRAFT_967516 [Pilatotrama ljubarskyi]|nr:hypothetical protein BV20DRAFT_967516 [Pilatotrama ljubarskyi]